MAELYAKGTDGKVNFGNDICVTDYSIDVGGDSADVTGTCTGGIKKSLDINDEITGSFGGNWDLNAMPTKNPPNVIRGAEGTAKFFVSATQFFSMPIRIVTTNVTSTVTDVIKWTATYIATGTIINPI